MRGRSRGLQGRRPGGPASRDRRSARLFGVPASARCWGLRVLRRGRPATPGRVRLWPARASRACPASAPCRPRPRACAPLTGTPRAGAGRGGPRGGRRRRRTCRWPRAPQRARRGPRPPGLLVKRGLGWGSGALCDSVAEHPLALCGPRDKSPSLSSLGQGG